MNARTLLGCLLAASMFATAAENDATLIEPHKWRTLRSNELGFEVQYPTFGHKTRAVPVLADVPGYSLQYYSNEKHLYCGLFSVMKSEGVPSDPQGLGRNAIVLASQGNYQLTSWLNRDGACSDDLAPAMEWLAAHNPEGRFLNSKHRG